MPQASLPASLLPPPLPPGAPLPHLPRWCQSLGRGGARATAMGRISPAALLTAVRRSPQLPPRGPMEELWAASMLGSS